MMSIQSPERFTARVIVTKRGTAEVAGIFWRRNIRVFRGVENWSRESDTGFDERFQ